MFIVPRFWGKWWYDTNTVLIPDNQTLKILNIGTVPLVHHLTPAALSSDPLADLIWLNTADLLRGFGITRPPWLYGIAAVLARLPAQRFARQLLAFDALVSAAGLPAGGEWMCSQFAPGLRIDGPTPPRHGPLLVVANHPGLLDAAALLAAIGRTDLKIIAIARPLIRALPNTAAAIIPVGATPLSRMAALRCATRHLQQGGAVLTFPAGQIEPDPARDPAAITALAGWSTSLDLFGRLAAGVPVVTAIVSDVQALAALRHPLTRLRRDPAERQWLAAIVQVLWPHLATQPVRVQFGPPLVADANIRSAVLAVARQLMQRIGEEIAVGNALAR
ncbi:1-acyl-sn-glycerol-3-phosphate acyltransferase [Chloroflexus sp.]|uniref:1-acyl-sn-glycerol-3-phosphate acyltransferase n=2 Tax=Chloroflexus sp. TaxID=1904827 RepID=UPI00298F007F|nr:1-acyl-sn-glycerol-3-phosphate acyltransferase [Chloroflexus sp.]MDW8405027.1 glycerol acyltransferase [Chloroflexus sp.]